LPLHIASGTQRTLVMRTEVTCGLAALFVLVPGAAVVGAAPAGAAPPVPAASAAAGPPPSAASAQGSDARRIAARSLRGKLGRVWAAVIAKRSPFAAGELRCPMGGVRG
jgi:hypothetical protein